MSELQCLFCSTQLVDGIAASAHLIPNALGGHLRTTRATCRQCDSEAGKTIDYDLVTKFAPLAGLLDLPRQRGDHPNFPLTDECSGLDYLLKAGRKPSLAPNLTVETSNGFHASVIAPTLEVAERLFKVFGIKIGPSHQVTGIPRGPDKFTLTLVNVNVTDSSTLRAIAKTAWSYARCCGIPIANTCLAGRFARGEGVAFKPVISPNIQIVRHETQIDNDILHSLSLFTLPQSPQNLFAHVTLFGAFDFLVWLDDSYSGTAVSHVYAWSLLTCRDVDANLRLLQDEQILQQQFSYSGELSPEYFRRRAEPLKAWLKDLNSFWFARAADAAAQAHFKALDSGLSEDEASSIAAEAMKTVLARYDLELGKFQITKA